MNVNVIDISCIVIVLIFAAYGYSKGIMKFVFHLGVTLVSAIGSRLAAVPVTNFLYSSILQDKITVQLYKLLPSGSVSGGINAIINAVTAALPDSAVKIADSLNLLPKNGEAISDEILSVAQLEAQYIRPIVTKVVLIITTLAIFVALVVILSLAVNFINKKFFEEKHGVISTANRILGGVLGIIRGIIPVAFLCAVLILTAPLFENEKLSFMIEGSYVCNAIAEIF
ncbi:MAG: hypothetical protein J1E34_10055 [Oscillospiraceae bacterium]|nr:hypothetical protein [Oscillospiraceae bacterium]